MNLRNFFTRAFSAAAAFFVLTASAQLQRVPNSTLAMPVAPPTFGFTFTNAFGNLTFTNPVDIATPPGETNRLFVVGKDGTIYVITNLMNPTRSVFMDISSEVQFTLADSGTTGEQGLCGMAFHPGFATNGFFYIFYTSIGGTNFTTGRHDILSRFKVSAANTNQGDPTSETPIIIQYDHDPNHNSGQLHFGADGYLYVSLGDEGAEYDGRTNAQRIDLNFFSGIIRIDVDKRPGNLTPNPSAEFATTTNYLVPADNPFIGLTNFDGLTVNSNNVRTEFWAVGLRNPWRWNFDPLTGLLYCADVGQDTYEEVNLITKGGNYGWAWLEGTNSSSVSAHGLPHLFATNTIAPIVTYAHSTGNKCVIGGPVYRGQKLSQLYGYYIFGDEVIGNIWTIPATQTNGTAGLPAAIFTDNSAISAFGTDPANGDVLYCCLNSGNNGVIKRIIYNSVTNGAPLPPTLADTGAFTNLFSLTSPQDTLQTAPGILPYTINVPFWSDNAIKSRWFSLPNTNLTIGFNPSGNWSFPTGTVWIKHFNLELTNGDPTSEIRLETRLLVKNSSGIYGVTYRWGGSKTNATLVPASGMDESFVINDGGILHTQVWHYPSQQECQTCHTSAGGFGLGFRTEQLNDTLDYGFGATNELQALSAAGYFTSPITNDVHTLLALATATNSSASLEFRSRSFLAANCSQCHQPGGTVSQANWDARITTPTALSGLINGALVNNLGDINNHVITPLSPTNSTLLTRDATRDLGANPSLQMPPLDSNLTDTEAMNLLTQWILSMTNTFWIGVSPDPQTITPGSSAVYSVTNLVTGDFTSSVTFSVSGLPSGTTGNFSPPTLTGSGSSALTVNTMGSTPQGNYTLTVTGIGGSQTNTDTFGLVIVGNIVSPGALLWTNASSTDTNWSTALNWTNLTGGGYGPPTSVNDLLFTNSALAASAGTTNNVVDSNFTVASLTYANNGTLPNYHVTLFKNNQTLIATNGLTIGTGTDAGANNVVNAVITGAGGTLIISNNFSVQQGSGTDGSHLATLDMSGLGTFSANVAKFGVGVYQLPALANAPRAEGILYLAKTNFITATSLGVTNGILIANNPNSGGAGTANKSTAVYLGQTNVFHADCITIGAVKSWNGALFAFNPNGLNNPVAFFRGISGDASRVSIWAIGTDFPLNGSNQSAAGTNDFSGGTVDALINNMTIGQTSTGASGTGITGSGVGILTFSAGTIDVNNLTNGWSQGTGTVTNNGDGIINVNGGTLKVNNSFVMAINTGTGFNGQSGTLNIRNGGKVLANNIIIGGGTNSITINNGTLILTNTAGTPASRISNFALTNSALHLNLNGNSISTNILVTNLIASGLDTISIDSALNVTSAKTFPLISYNSFTGSVAANFIKGTLPNGFVANLVDNSSARRIDLVIAASTNVTPHIGPITLSGNNFIFGGSNGFPGGNYYVLTSSNIALPLNLWTPIATNPFDVNGGFNFTNPMSTNAQLFYLLQLQ